MSLEALFEDRKKRIFIREGVEKAKDFGKGTCSTCGSEGFLLEAFELNICEDCCEKIVNLSESYEHEIPRIESFNAEYISTYVNEATIFFDMDKMQKEADKKYGGDLKELCKSYKCSAYKIMSDKIDFQTATTASGKSRINQLMIDFDGEFGTEKSALTALPDPDGTLAPLKVKGKGIIQGGGTPAVASNVAKVSTPAAVSTPTKVSTVPQSQSTPSATSVDKKASSAQSVSSVAVASGKVSGNISSIEFSAGKALVKLTLVPGNGKVNTYNVVLVIGGKDIKCNDVNVKETDSKDIKSVIAAVKKEFAVNPQGYFGAFEGISSSTYKIVKYSIYEFAFDEQSFEKALTMVAVYKGKKYPKERIEIPERALENRSIMSSTLLEYLDKKIETKYPMLGSGKNRVKTSVGDAVFNFDTIEDSGILSLQVDWAGKIFNGRADGSRFGNEREASAAFSEILYNNFKHIIPDWDDKKWPVGGKKDYRVMGNGYEVSAVFDSDSFDKEGKMDFLVRVSKDGVLYPDDKGIAYTFKEVGTSIDAFLIKVGEDLEKKYLKGSNMRGDLKPSALEKMKNPSKKEALLSRVAETVKGYMSQVMGLFIDNKRYKNFSVDVDMDISSIGKVVDATVYINDLEGLSVSELETCIKEFEGRVEWAVFKGVEKKEDGLVATIEVVNVEKFSSVAELELLEGAILEAYGISKVRRAFIV